MGEALIRGVLKRLMTGHLLAWDPGSQKEVWRVPQSSMWNGGVLATAGGLVFQGSGDGHLYAYRAETGERLWQAPAGSGVVAPPITYELDGEQYLAVMAGWGGAAPLTFDMPGTAQGQPGRLLVFKLDATETLPAPLPVPALKQPPPRQGTDEMVQAGEVLYAEHCGRCHGGALMNSAVVPDLRQLSAEKHGVFRNIVLDGIFQGTGMAGFADVLDVADADAIQAYVLDAANDQWEEAQLPGWWRALKAWFLDLVAAVMAFFLAGPG